MSDHDGRLRELQQRYYGAEAKDDGVIFEYLQTLAAARAEWLGAFEMQRPVALHLGSGGHNINGFINIDIDVPSGVDVAADLTRSLPLRDGSVDYIHSEDFIEHVDLEAGRRILAECHRVLKPGGVMRILTPDLRKLVQKVYLGRDPAHLQWCRAYLEADGPCEALNMHLRMLGDHRFVYDEECLTRILSSIGFRVRSVAFNESSVPFLRYLDLRDFGLNLFMECEKG